MRLLARKTFKFRCEYLESCSFAFFFSLCLSYVLERLGCKRGKSMVENTWSLRSLFVFLSFARKKPASTRNLFDDNEQACRCSLTLFDNYLCPMHCSKSEFWSAARQNFFAFSLGFCLKTKHLQKPLSFFVILGKQLGSVNDGGENSWVRWVEIRVKVAAWNIYFSLFFYD